MGPHPFFEWFGHWKTSLHYKLALQWYEHNNPNVPLAHPNVVTLAGALYTFWVDRYTKQFPGARGSIEAEDDNEALKLLNPKMPQPIEVPPYEEFDDDNLFQELLVIHSRAFRSFGVAKALVYETSKRYAELRKSKVWTLRYTPLFPRIYLCQLSGSAIQELNYGWLVSKD